MYRSATIACAILAASCGRAHFDPLHDATDAPVIAADAPLANLAQQAYIKPSSAHLNFLFGTSVSLSSDGSYVAASTPMSTLLAVSGLYVFQRIGAAWSTYGTAGNLNLEGFATLVDISGDGITWVAGAEDDASNATGIGGDALDNSAPNAGAAMAYVNGMQSYIKASNTDSNDRFGAGIAVSADGLTLAVGAPYEGSAATGINGNQADNSLFNAGAVYVFTYSGTTWSQQAYIKSSTTAAGDLFGYTIGLSADGATMAVGSPGEASAIGAVHIFGRNGAIWTEEARVTASTAGSNEGFALELALSGDGSTLAVGEPIEPSAATGIDGDQSDASAARAGAVYVFARAGTTWHQEAYVKASNTETNDEFGFSVALSGDGSILACGSHQESSGSPGIGGDQADNSIPGSGAVYLYARTQATWHQFAYVKASNPGAGDGFGDSVALSADASTLAVGAPFEASNATGVGGDESNDVTVGDGAVYVFR